MKMPKMTIQKIRSSVGIKYFCSGILFFNVLYLTILFVFPFGFATITAEYSIFFVLFALSIVCAAFAIHDEKDLLVYPYFCVSLFISFIGFAVFAFQLTTVYFCAFISIQKTGTINQIFDVGLVVQPVKYYDCSFILPNFNRWDSIQAPILTSLVFFILAVEKLIECYYFRKLQKCFRRHVAVLIDTPFSTPPLSTIMINDDSESEEMVIYEKNGENQTIREHSVHQTENLFEKDFSNYLGTRIIA